MSPADSLSRPDGGPIALVTGAGSGIGHRVALRLAESGWSVALAGRRTDALEATAAELAGASDGDRHLVVPTDVRDAASVDALFDRVEEHYGRLDLLFNNAGVSARPRAPDAVGVDEWNAVVETNLNGTFFCTRRAFGLMKRQEPRGGRIVNNGSISAHVPRPGSIAYTATKHAVTGITRATALDGRAHDIACGQIDIGNAQTGLMSATTGLTQPDGSVRPEAVMDVEHAASAVLYMAGLPLDANVLFMTVMATTMPYVGRG
jgi:NAD(P)-dependent dehydrogenase (short-subunit alcohol dehydrogenase family)